MYKNTVKTALAFAGGSTTHFGVSHVLPQVTQASARRQARHPRNWKEVIGYAVACLLIAAMFDIALINMLAYPDCNRETRDCFLVHHLWAAR